MTALTTERIIARETPLSYGFTDVARMEWIKLRTLRSTWWSLAIALAAAVGFSIAAGTKTTPDTFDVTNHLLVGIAIGFLVTGVIGALVMSSEYSSGLIRGTLAAVPRRGLLLAAKAAVFGTVALVVGELASFLSFFVGSAAMPGDITAPSLTDLAALRAVVLAGVAYSLIGLMGLGLATLVRHTAASIAILIGGVYVVAQVLGGLFDTIRGYVPISLVANSLSAAKHPQDGAPNPWLGLAVLSLYAALALGAGAWRLLRQDA
jgi:ABC-2 type transport system permease protein